MLGRPSTHACKVEQTVGGAELWPHSSVHNIALFDSSTKDGLEFGAVPKQNRLSGLGFGRLLQHYPKSSAGQEVPRVPAPFLMGLWFEVLELSRFFVLQTICDLAVCLCSGCSSFPWKSVPKPKSFDNLALHYIQKRSKPDPKPQVRI